MCRGREILGEVGGGRGEGLYSLSQRRRGGRMGEGLWEAGVGGGTAMLSEQI